MTTIAIAFYLMGVVSGIAVTILADARAKRNAKQITDPEALLHGERAIKSAGEVA